MKDCYDKKYLRKLLLNYKIRTEIKTRMGRVILLAVPFSETMIDNIYLLSDDENIIWRVETSKTVPDKLPYENMSISKDKSKIYATDFYGRRSIIDIETGYIEDTDCVKQKQAIVICFYIRSVIINQLYKGNYTDRNVYKGALDNMREIENYKNHNIIIDDNEYTIAWFRGKEFFSYEVMKSLAEKSRKSDKDALEVMFYLENNRWPKEGELKDYNKTDVKTYVGSDFTIYEENGKYEIGIEKDIGRVGIGEVYYPITKELMKKALKSDRDAYEVIIYAETGSWPTNNQEETDRKFIREFPELVLKNPERCKKLFFKEEYEHLVKIAKEE